MSGPPSVRRLLVWVVIVAAIMVGLARWAGRGTGTGGGTGTRQPDSPGGIGDSGPGSMSVPGDLTFYKTLGSARPAPPPTGGLSSAGNSNNDDDDAGRLTAPRAPGGHGAYVVQALATRDPAAARRLRARLASRGFPAIVQEDRTGSVIIYRVQAARYRTRAEAETAVQALRRDRLSAWILQEGE